MLRQRRFYHLNSVYFTTAVLILSQRCAELTATLPIYYFSIDYIVEPYRTYCNGADFAAVIARGYYHGVAPNRCNTANLSLWSRFYRSFVRIALRRSRLCYCGSVVPNLLWWCRFYRGVAPISLWRRRSCCRNSADFTTAAPILLNAVPI